jgi:hypothetical protein
MAMGRAAFSYESSLSTHSIGGTFGAAAAAACVASLDARQMRWALDYTAQQSSGIRAWRRDTDHIEKAFVFGGMPARNGVTSALLVRSDWNGIDDIFSGADNFFLAYAPKAQPERLVEKLGERYEIVQTDIKKWTVGSPIQGPLDAIDAIHGKRPFDADQVLSVTVRLAPSVAEVVDNRDIPDICTRNGRNSSCSASDERRDGAETFMAKQVIVPARSGKAVKIREGACVKLINTEGSQVVDTWAFNASDMKEFMSMEHTRVMLGRVNPKCGDDLFSNRRRVLLNIIEDTSPGVHDTLRAACDPERYRLLFIGLNPEVND